MCQEKPEANGGQHTPPITISYRLFLMEELEDIRDARTISAAIAAGEETYSHEFVKRLSSDESPLKVWREYRKFHPGSFGKGMRRVNPGPVPDRKQ